MATITYTQWQSFKRVADAKIQEVTLEDAEEEIKQRLSSGFKFKFGKRSHKSATLYKINPSGIELLITIMF